MKISPAQVIKERIESGQALLIVLLGMAVVLTLVLSIVSRSVTDVSITQKDEDSLRAFSAAEAGIEQMLVGGPTTSEFPESNSSFTGSVTDIGGQNYYNMVNNYASGEVGLVWFVSHDTNGNIKCDGQNPCINPSGKSLNMCWGTNLGSTPAIEISLFYDRKEKLLTSDFFDVKIARATFNSNESRRNKNFFGQASETNCTFTIGPTYRFTSGYKSFLTDLGLQAGYNQEGCLLFARIKIFYNSAPDGIGVALDSGTFPAQAIKVTSSGFSGEATRKVEAIQTFDEFLQIFDNAVFSNSGDLSK